MGNVKYAIVFILVSFFAIGQVNAQTLKNDAKQTKTEVKTPVAEKDNHTAAPTVKHVAKGKSEVHVIKSDQAKAGDSEKAETNSRSQELKSSPMTPR